MKTGLLILDILTLFAMYAIAGGCVAVLLFVVMFNVARLYGLFADWLAHAVVRLFRKMGWVNEDS